MKNVWLYHKDGVETSTIIEFLRKLDNWTFFQVQQILELYRLNGKVKICQYNKKYKSNIINLNTFKSKLDLRIE